jgi:CubicO group peptidase (beta-lactamase class C family)
MRTTLHIKYLFLLILSVLTVGFCSGQHLPNAEYIDSDKVKALMKTSNIQALGIGFIREGRLQELKVYGEQKKGQPATLNTLFNVASITKTVTSMVTLRLVSMGKWNIDEPLYHYWIDPDVRDDSRSKILTTRHILTHQTGFPNWRWQTQSKKLTFEFDPGTRFQYSGEGFEYLRHALENKFHRSLEQLADSLIFKPLHMQNTSYVWNDEMVSHFAFSHNAKGEEMDFYKNTLPNAADMLRTTITDYSLFMAAIIKKDGLSKELFEEMVSPQVKIKENKFMGLGWAVYTNLGNGEYAISHSGVDPGVNTIAFILPKSKRGLLIFTNSDNGPQIYTELVKAYLKEQGQAISDIEMKK